MLMLGHYVSESLMFLVTDVIVLLHFYLCKHSTLFYYIHISYLL